MPFGLPSPLFIFIGKAPNETVFNFNYVLGWYLLGGFPMDKKFTPKPKVDFANNEPVILTLDVDPTVAKVTKNGSYTFFTAEGQVFWADEELLVLLKDFGKGSVVSITRQWDFNNKTNNWTVTASEETPSPVFEAKDNTKELEKRVKTLEDQMRTLMDDKEKGEETPF